MSTQGRNIDRSIAALAFPALGALVAEPLFLAVDSALVGHLGQAPLAGLAIASAILTTAIGLMVFLAYSTTPLVARRRGSGDTRGAVQAGVDGLWLALGLGIAVAIVMWFGREMLVGFFSSSAAVAEQAVIYLGVSALGMPAMLLVFAATGLLRGMLDTVTPLTVAVIGFAVNAGLNWLFIYGFGWGIAGSAWGTVIAQWGMVLCYLIVIAKHVRRHGAGWLPQAEGLKHAGRSGGWLFVRTLGLRVALLATVSAAATQGVATTAAYQIVFLVISITAFMLDALAIAAQALIGDALGASDEPRVRLVLSRTLRWGVRAALIIGVPVALVSPFVGRVFTNDAAVLGLLPPSIAAVGLTLPLAAIVYVLDGVLMGAGDARYLAIVSMGALVIYLPLLFFATQRAPEGAPALLTITLAFTVGLMALRALTLAFRARGGRWIVLGGERS
ncbi:MATE family efflux transporter [Leucobacter chinensis]|uniref:MATE family efflux transporter n=1 Tax=Leucobacter chinensis TaxID=2851010 RepID=UPI001C222178